MKKPAFGFLVSFLKKHVELARAGITIQLLVPAAALVRGPIVREGGAHLCRLRDLDTDLPEVNAGLHVMHRVAGLVEGEDAIDHGAELACHNGPVHRFEHLA
jgi:hypothetical protein